MITDAVTDECGPWNPGITSQVPADILPLASIFRPENVFTSLEAARELHAMTGLSLAEVVRFRPQRLALHEILIRVTADFTVPDGSRIGDLGINFRRIAGRLLTEHVAPRMAELVAVYEQAHRELKVAADAALREVASAPAPPAVIERRRGPRLFRRAASSAMAPAAQTLRAGWELPQIALLETMSGTAGSSRAIIAQALVRVMSALFATHGQSWGTRDFIISVAADLAANAYC
ncbi:MAG: hypothetical protein M3O06_08640, partial [Pseudomonadota bacterium]|nr:hypothetical protein [Pseudomonadota bacterium]